MKRVKCVCANCGKEILKYPSAVRETNYCNKQCIEEHRQKKRVKRQCKQCGKEFYILKSVIGKGTNASGNFCCRKCYNKYLTTLTNEKNKSYNRVEMKCPQCGKAIKVIPSRAEEYKHSFCSRECKDHYMFNYIGREKNPNWQGGTSAYRGDFDRVKREYFAKDIQCAICGTKEKIHIHHIIPYRLTQDNGIDNLIPLCASHHKTIEIKTVELLRTNNNYDAVRNVVKEMIRSEHNADN